MRAICVCLCSHSHCVAQHFPSRFVALTRRAAAGLFTLQTQPKEKEKEKKKRKEIKRSFLTGVRRLRRARAGAYSGRDLGIAVHSAQIGRAADPISAKRRHCKAAAAARSIVPLLTPKLTQTNVRADPL